MKQHSECLLQKEMWETALQGVNSMVWAGEMYALLELWSYGASERGKNTGMKDALAEIMRGFEWNDESLLKIALAIFEQVARQATSAQERHTTLKPGKAINLPPLSALEARFADVQAIPEGSESKLEHDA